VANETGMSSTTICEGKKGLPSQKIVPEVEEIWPPGGGRVSNNSTNKRLLKNLVDPVTRGDPEPRLKWTSKSRRNLVRTGLKIGPKTSGNAGMNPGSSQKR